MVPMAYIGTHGIDTGELDELVRQAVQAEAFICIRIDRTKGILEKCCGELGEIILAETKTESRYRFPDSEFSRTPEECQRELHGKWVPPEPPRPRARNMSRRGR